MNVRMIYAHVHGINYVAIDAQVTQMGLRQRFAHAPRKPTNVSLNEAVLACAQALNINISQAAEKGIEREIAERQTEIWLQENKLAIESANDYVAKYGLPLTAHRQF